jgi:hypothetical protein
MCASLAATALASERINAMNDTTDDLDQDQTDEEILTCEVPDEALELAAAGTGGALATAGTWGGPYPCGPAHPDER